ncbi:hypothetical protein AAMO2058_001651600 [Amorphochlora amoebiformis]
MHNRMRNIQLVLLYHVLVARFDDRWSLNGSYLVDIGLQLAQAPEEGCKGKTLGERGRHRMLVVSTQGEIWRKGGEYNILHVNKTLPARGGINWPEMRSRYYATSAHFKSKQQP